MARSEGRFDGQRNANTRKAPFMGEWTGGDDGLRNELRKLRERLRDIHGVGGLPTAVTAVTVADLVEYVEETNKRLNDLMAVLKQITGG